MSRARAFQVELNEQNDKQADINKPELKIDIQKTESKIEQDQEVKKSQVSKPPPDISGKKGFFKSFVDFISDTSSS